MKQIPDYSLQVRRDGKNIIQLGIFNFQNELVFEAESLADLKREAGNVVVSFAGQASAPLNSFEDDDLK